MLPDWVKVALLIPILFGLGPLAGFLVRNSRPAQRVIFALMMILTMFNYRMISTSPGFPQDAFYRGHTRGYEFTLMEFMAMALIFAGRGPARLRGPWFPPGIFLYLAYTLMGLLSIFNSLEPGFTMMAFGKFAKAALVFVAAFHFFREEKDIRFWLKVVSGMLIAQALICIFQKYHYHIHQPRAWFEHQNSMVMYTYMLALPLLSSAMSPFAARRESLIYGAGYIGGGICAVLALSRAGLAAFIAGSVIVVALSLLDRITTKRLVIISAMAVLSVMGSIVFADSVVARFLEKTTGLSEITRELLNESSRHMIRDHPLIGTGWNTYGIMINPPHPYGENFDDFARSMGKSRYVDSQFGRPISESWYYLVMAETGLLGIAALFLFLFTMLFWNAKAVWRYRHSLTGMAAMGIFAGTGMNYLQCNYERVLTQPKNMVAWLVCLGLVSRMEWWRRQGYTPSSGPAQPDRRTQPAPAPLPAARPNPPLPEPGRRAAPAKPDIRIPAPGSAETGGSTKPDLSTLPPPKSGGY